MPAFLALNGGAVLAALAVAVALGLGRPARRLLLAVVAGYLAIAHSTVLAAGLAGHLTVAGMATIVGVIDVGAIWLLVRTRARVTDLGPDGSTDGPRFTTVTLLPPLAALGSALVWVWPHLFHATRLWVWDDYTYHMVYPALWLREHAITAATPPTAFTMQAWARGARGQTLTLTYLRRSRATPAHPSAEDR